MTIDLSQFYQMFFDETAEHLATLENLLLAIDPAMASQEDLNAMFRAAHSIKGGAGTFGFSDITGVTHALESLLDRVRKEELSLSREMVDVFLQAGDVINAQLAAHRVGDLADTRQAREVCAKLEQLRAGGPAAPAVPSGPAAPLVASAPAAAAAVYDISFSTTCARTAREALLDNLRSLGELEILTQPAARKRGRKAQNWKLRFTTGAPQEQWGEFFEFVTSALEINARQPAAERAAAEQAAVGHAAAEQAAAEPAAVGQAAAPAADAGYGFFDAAAGAPPSAEDPGYGFFVDLPAPARGSGRRAIDQPGHAPEFAGRRDGDKLVVAPHGEATSIRVGVEKVDTLINLVGELVITQAMLAQTSTQIDPVLYEKLLNGLAQLERNTRDLQESVMSIRMMPISFVFSRFPRVVRELADKLDKQVELRTEGEATELDKGVIEKLADPLTHLVRNSLDHGIESPDVRRAAGKPAKGVITLRAFHQGGNIIVEVVDDGAGMERERLLAKARERGIAAPDSMSDQDVFQLIFEAGFSTAAQVTDVSGRGVGMDVVRRNIRAMGGKVEISSFPGAGTRIRIRLPLTLAILDGLSVSVGGEMFIVPLTYIIESLQPAAADLKTVRGRGRVVQVRGEYLPLVALHEVFNLQPLVAEVHKGIVVILEVEGRKTAMFVDALVGQHQVVIKSLETNYRRVQGVSGATIMGDGRVALILDAAGLVAASQHEVAQAA